jgi:hypothetical protein
MWKKLTRADFCWEIEIVDIFVKCVGFNDPSFRSSCYQKDNKAQIMNLLKFIEHKKPLFLFHSFTLGNKFFREQPTDFV